MGGATGEDGHWEVSDIDRAEFIIGEVRQWIFEVGGVALVKQVLHDEVEHDGDLAEFGACVVGESEQRLVALERCGA